MSKADKFSVVSLDDLAKKQSDRIEKGYISFNEEEKPVLTAEEAKEYFGMYLDDRVRWALCRGPFREQCDFGYTVSEATPTDGSITTGPVATETAEEEEAAWEGPTDAELQEVADKIYKDIVLSYRYDAFLLDITRKAKMTKKTISDAVNECAADLMDEMEESESGKISPFSKALKRSILRVNKELGENILEKGFKNFKGIMNTRVGYPIRVAQFVKAIQGDIEKAWGKEAREAAKLSRAQHKRLVQKMSKDAVAAGQKTVMTKRDHLIASKKNVAASDALAFYAGRYNDKSAGEQALWHEKNGRWHANYAKNWNKK